MWLFNQASSAARISLTYITIGAMSVIWTGVWYVYLYNNPPETHSVFYLCAGFLVTGLILILIGFGLGHIGRSAQCADLPAQHVVPAVMNAPPAPASPVAVVAPPDSTGVLAAPTRY
jgi:RsiW-degrading membrane proteinase PrsW (M82 family)